jgi:(S)-ureidoglycine aminohydrolase
MSDLFGSTRTRVAARHALITPDGFVGSVVPGARKVKVVFHITPAMGAEFTQAGLWFETGGDLVWPCEEGTERMIYVTKGSVEVACGGKRKVLAPGGFAFCPPDEPCRFSAKRASEATVFEKRHEEAAGVPLPAFYTGSSRSVKGAPFLGNPKALLQVLLPDSLPYDMAVNAFTYQPGTTLPFVETHIMEHGLLMLSGQGIYRLEDSWYPVKAGDVIWMAPYCPQWFVAVGDEPASYLYYKNVNRLPELL